MADASSACCTRVFVGLGSNLGDRLATLSTAVRALAATAGIENMVVSRVVESAPMGPPDQPDYANAVCRFDCGLEPLELLDRLQQLEADASRDRSVGRWRERTLDLDLLVFGDERMATDRLTLPHPGIATRLFVLQPLAELEPALVIPGQGTVASLLRRFPDGDLPPLGDLVT